MASSVSSDDETSIETHSESKETKCIEDKTSTCESLKRIVGALKYYQSFISVEKINNVNNDNFISFFKQYTDLINDYHHTLTFHSNSNQQENDKSFEEIYSYIIQQDIKCNHNVNKCKSFLRNHRERDKDKLLSTIDDELVLFYIDIMDTIHSHLLHSYDIGYRVKLDEINKTNKIDKIDDNDDHKELYTDTEIIQLKQLISKNCNDLHQIQGEICLNNNRFLTKHVQENEETEDKEEKKEEYEKRIDINTEQYNEYFFGKRDSIDEISDDDNDSDSDSFQDGTIPKMKDLENENNLTNFGAKYFYWNYYKYNYKEYNKWFVDKKYKNLKEEMINNKLYRIDLKTYNYIYYKSNKLLKESDELKSMKSDYTELVLHYNIDEGLPLNASNIMVLLFYCDFKSLSNNFRKTFRRLTFYNESLKQMKLRNREYWNWSKILRETVECYGKMMEESKINNYYHCINNDILFKSFNVGFNSPTSISSNLNVIYSHCRKQKNGIILQLEPMNDSSSLRFFDCSFVSSYSNLNEKIIFGGKYCMKINSIRNFKTNQNFKFFLSTIQLLDDIMSDDQQINDDNDINISQQKIMKLLIENISMIPNYIKNLFQQYCDKKRKIEIDLNAFNEVYKKVKHFFLDKRTNNLVLIDKICNVYKNCEKITVDNNAKHISSRYLSTLASMIQTINQNQCIQLRYLKIERIQFDQKQFNSSISLFTKNNWDITIKHEKAMQFGQWINVATLNLIRLPIENITNISNVNNITNNAKTKQSRSNTLILQSTTSIAEMP